MTKLLYLVTEAGYFFSHRYSLAKEAQKKGYEVCVATVCGSYHQRLVDEGFKVFSLKKMTRTGANPFKQLSSLIEIYKIYRQEKPDIVHHVAMKPVVYGSIAAWAARVKGVVNALTGLGYVFISSSFKAQVIRFFLWRIFTVLFRSKNQFLIVQNKDDFELFSKIVSPNNLVLIRGSGVNTDHFYPAAKLSKRSCLRIVLLARLLWDKGIQEAIEAISILKSQGSSIEFVLAGGLDPQNPSSIQRSHVEKWQRQGLCTWLGKIEDVNKLYQESDIALLPSYREGLPKSLLEAAACGLPIVTTDVPGCREVVRHGKTGLLVPVKRVGPIVEALEKLLTNPSLRQKIGKEARKSVEKHFSEKIVIQETLSIYEKTETNLKF